MILHVQEKKNTQKTKKGQKKLKTDVQTNNVKIDYKTIAM